MHSLLGELDAVAKSFKSNLNEAKTLTAKRKVVNDAIVLIDKILGQGANRGYTTEAALRQIETNREQLEKALDHFYK